MPTMFKTETGVRTLATLEVPAISCYYHKEYFGVEKVLTPRDGVLTRVDGELAFACAECNERARTRRPY